MVSDGSGATELFLEKRQTPPEFLGQKALCRQRGRPRCPHHPQAWPGLARVARGCGPLVALLRPANPYHPHSLQWGITHSWMGETWMVDG